MSRTFGFKNWRQVVRAYQENTQAVRNVFEGFFSPGLISRMCVDLNTTGSFDCCETSVQVTALTEALHGHAVRYSPDLDPELADVVS